MNQPLNRTVLHDRHEARGGKMVDFAGWRMPVRYRTGIIAEHLATRRAAGLFDVSHMGRYRVRGPGAESFLLKTLTNNAAGLAPLEAQYTFIANEAGGAVDDAYLYKLAEEDFLLVVNAGNRAADWEWLGRYLPGSGVAFADESDALAMLSLQGPAASGVLTRLVAPSDLPENKRNRLSVAGFEGGRLVIARTGYTGEPVCFELFPESGAAAALWEGLVEAGATPVGLGARDSLRLEAGLPLYGHELGPGPDGRDIPLFANAIARFAVRIGAGAGTGEDCVGGPALRAQRAEYERIRRREIAIPPHDRRLTHLVQPVAVFDGRRPLRQGYKVTYRDEDAGWITSGTTVPCAVFEGEGLAARPGDAHAMRPIGLALLRSDLLPRSHEPLHVEVLDGRGNAMTAQVVERNAWPLPPFVRPFRGFEAPAGRGPVLARGPVPDGGAGRDGGAGPDGGQVSDGGPVPARGRTPAAEAESLAARLAVEAERNHRWRRTECVNLIPSENCVSAFVERLCASDPAGRYNEHNRLRALGVNSEDVRYYKGTAFSMEKEEALVAALRTFFGCADAEVRVISGQMANDTVYDALKQFRNRHRGRRTPLPLRRVLVHDLNKGGHLSAQTGGALRNYVAHDPRTERPAVDHFALRRDLPHAIDVEETAARILEGRPDLIVFGRSVIIHTEPVRAIVERVHRGFGADNPERPLVMYDAAHVLGLLGEHFQDPLAEGADVVTGSTHKTFFGPQRGVILTNVGPGHVFEELWQAVASRAFPGHVSNHHLGTLLGLLGATCEMIRYRDEYPPRVIRNARAFARALAGHGLAVEGDPAVGYTDTHQVLVRGARGASGGAGVGGEMADRLERNNVITNPQAFYDDASFAAASGIRLGTQEMTRFGMDEPDFEALAGLIARILLDDGSAAPDAWRGEVVRFRERFTRMRYHL